MFLCYDIKGIQKFIFSVPKLKCVIGASGMIADFDARAKNLAGDEWIFSGGGRGAFCCKDAASAEQLADKLIERAHERGLDIRIGIDPTLTRAAQHADRLHPYRPPTLDGEPCGLSGLWPVPKRAGKGPRQEIHPLIWERIEEAREDSLGQTVLKQLAQRNGIPNVLDGYQLQFFKNVNPASDDLLADRHEAMAARAALGNRNRWAVIAMDGNDMGRQFQAFESRRTAADQPGDVVRDWLREMSGQLEHCTREAFLAALAVVLRDWAEEADARDQFANCTIPGSGDLVLPFRPLILGGDDVVLLCHADYAMTFVRAMAERFEQLSRQAADQSQVELWPATGGRLTISAGILFTKVTFPLHMAIPYAESLLASAKGRYRADPRQQTPAPTPAAVDWDSVTDTLLDTPAARRNRELRFHDQELGREIRLTRRPYLLRADGQHPDLPALLELAGQLQTIAPSVRSRILPALQGPWSERAAFVASLAKRHPWLMRTLWEGGDIGSTSWVANGACQETGLPDALLLLEEEHRMARPTVTNQTTA